MRRHLLFARYPLLAGALALAVSLQSIGCDQVDCGPEISGPVPAAELPSSPVGEMNQVQVARFLAERQAGATRDFWLAVVPGTSEQWGHHKAPPLDEDEDGFKVSDEFGDRLDMAFRFLQADVVRFLLVTGGAIDTARPEYVEALRGRSYLVRKFGDQWPGPEPLEEHILIDPLAEHSTTNIRNADKLSVDLGLNRNLIVTTMPAGNGLAASGLGTQGFYFLDHSVSTFDASCRSDFGYELGSFHIHAASDRDGRYLEGIRHCQLAVQELRRDSYGP